MEIKTRQIDDKPLTVIIEYPVLDTKTQKLQISDERRSHFAKGGVTISD